MAKKAKDLAAGTPADSDLFTFHPADGSSASKKIAKSDLASLLGSLSVVTATLTNAQIKALPTTPVEIIPAPGPGFVIIGLFATIKFTWVADYTNIDTNGFLELGTSAGAGSFKTPTPGETANILQPGMTSFNWWPAIAAIRAGDGSADVDNLAYSLSLENQGAGPLTGGNAGNSMLVTAVYLTVAL